MDDLTLKAWRYSNLDWVMAESLDLLEYRDLNMDENFAEVEPESVNLPHRARAGKIEGALLKTMNLTHFVEHLVELEPSIWPPLSHLLPIPH